MNAETVMTRICGLSLSPAPLRLCVRSFLTAVSLVVSSAFSATAANDAEALRKACDFLWSQQADDGGWHSTQYAVLRSGQALTPFILHTLLGTIDAMSSDETGRVMRAVEFIHRHLDDDGSIGHADPDIIEYPVYSTAYSVLCLKRIQSYRHLHGKKNYEFITLMEAYLSRAQFDDNDGFTARDAAYGGWGFDAAQLPGQPGHMDLAHTRRALEALHARAGGFSRDYYRPQSKLSVIRERAAKFLKLVQKHPDVGQSAPFDGGFYFSPVVLAANKGREEEKDGAKYFRSYATATCDGVLALLAAGVSRDDERVLRAVEWLKAHDDVTYPQGVPTDHPEPWGEAIRFYHYAVRAEAYAALDWPGNWQALLAAEVARHQAADGSFRNMVSPLMKEDDPLLCTTLAAIALTHCASDISGRRRGEEALER